MSGYVISYGRWCSVATRWVSIVSYTQPLVQWEIYLFLCFSRPAPAIKSLFFESSIPESWFHDDRDHDYELIALDPDKMEFHLVASAFRETLSSGEARICDIFRIQNSFLWHKYVRLGNLLSVVFLIALCLVVRVTLRRARLVLGWVSVYGKVDHLSTKPANWINSTFYLLSGGKMSTSWVAINGDSECSTIAACRQIWGSGWLASKVKGRWLLVACAALTKWTGWTLAVAVRWYNDSIININYYYYKNLSTVNEATHIEYLHFCHLFLIVIHCTCLTELYCLRYSVSSLVYPESEKLSV